MCVKKEQKEHGLRLASNFVAYTSVSGRKKLPQPRKIGMVMKCGLDVYFCMQIYHKKVPIEVLMGHLFCV